MKNNQNSQLTRRQSSLIIASVAMIGGFGCATMVTSSGGFSSTKVKEGEIVFTDTILALGRPDASMTAAVDNPNVVAFLGRSHTYFLGKGGEKLMSLAQQLDHDQLVLEPDNHKLYVRGQTIWGSLHLTYTLKFGLQATEVQQERGRLLKLGFFPGGNGTYASDIAIEGVVRPAVKLPDSITTLRRTPDLVFRAPPTTETTPNVGKLAMLPLAIIVDIVTAPIQLLGLLVIGVGLASSR
jgi:hypothetical protein